MSTRGGRIDTGFATARSRHLGAVHLIGAGVVNVALAVTLMLSIGSEFGFRLLLTALKPLWGESGLLEHGGTLALILDIAPVVVAFALLIGIVQIGSGVAALTGRCYRMAVASAIVGATTIVTIPIGAIAAVLLWCSRDQFRDPLSGEGT